MDREENWAIIVIGSVILIITVIMLAAFALDQILDDPGVDENTAVTHEECQ